ncbi:YhhA family cyclophane-containing RiPP [Sphingomonas bacterium]|uniref:YhhA family cyclophane-containing RiPP n=1 Tax=Sphingomonas bacterium TaxID=1895847 RepID=UPI001575D389|nr:YhhA family cyclophane-containing RiPP [Sphingomonas bacterium]
MESTRIAPTANKARPTTVQLDSVALARLMEEVRNSTESQPTAYNRMHNRHNR